MAGLKALLWIGIGLALAFHVIYLIIKFFKMEAELQKVKGLLELDAARKVLESAKVTVVKAQERVEKHYNNWKRLNEHRDKPTKWNYQDWPTGDESVKELAKSVLRLMANDHCTMRKKAIQKAINEYSGKRQDELLTQIEALLELYAKDRLKYDIEEESLTLEEAELQARLQEIAKRKEEKAKKS